MAVLSGSMARALRYKDNASLFWPARALESASSASVTAAGACADAFNWSAKQKTTRLRPFAITVFDMPAHGRGWLDFFKETLCGVNAARNCEQKPVEGRINDANGIVTDDFRVVFGIHPRSARELEQTRRVQ